MGVAKQPPSSLSVHAQCFWEFTPTERRVMHRALDTYMGELVNNKAKQSQEYRVAMMLFDALLELSTQD